MRIPLWALVLCLCLSYGALAQTDSVRWVSTRLSKTYHRSSCVSAPTHSTQWDSLVYFRSAAEAEGAGYRRCVGCAQDYGDLSDGHQYQPSLMAGFDLGPNLWLIDFQWCVKSTSTGTLSLGAEAGATWGGGNEAPGTPVDGPFSWWTQQADFQNRATYLAGTLDYCFSFGFVSEVSVGVVGSEAFTVWYSPVSQTYWNKSKGHESTIFLRGGIGYLFPHGPALIVSATDSGDFLGGIRFMF